MQKSDIIHYSIAVLAGGWSDEAEISLQSGTECVRALKEAGFSHVELFDIKDLSFIQRLQSGEFDVAFVALHGKYGEDGCIQGLLEILHIPYTGSGVLASALGMSKDMAKLAYEHAHIPTPKACCVQAEDGTSEELVDTVLSQLQLPVFVKPTNNGSSFGISRVTDASELPDALQKALAVSSSALVEDEIKGTEITVPVLGNNHPHALPIVEIRFNSDFYDIAAKAEPASMHHVIPAELPEDVYRRAQDLACAAHVALGCKGVSRSDFIVTAEGVPYILETNIIPGMTERSLIPDAARHAGMSFAELCYGLVQNAVEDRC